MFRADLHCHSTCSDGSLSPEELVQLAKKIDLQGLSITDHDNIDAYKTACGAAKKEGILLGTGVEFSCTWQDRSVHVLGYDYSLDNKEIQEFCKRHRNRRKERNKAILDKLAKFNMVIDEKELEEFSSEKTIGRPHIAELMVRKGYVTSLREAFDRFIGDGRPCYDPGVPITIDETIGIIHGAKGKAFLAHPHLYDHGRWVKDILHFPFDGIECHYAKFTPDVEKKFLRIAEEKNLLISGGSDFHGDMKPHIGLGSSWVNEETFHKIFEKPV